MGKEMKKKWIQPTVKKLNIKTETAEIIVHKKEVSPSWS